MLGSGKCPLCQKTVSRLTVEGVDAAVPMGTTWKAITLQCPSCRAILGAQIDPIAVKADIVSELARELRR